MLKTSDIAAGDFSLSIKNEPSSADIYVAIDFKRIEI